MKPVLPGQFPYKRGVDPLGYRETPCATLPLAGFGDPAQTNRELRMLASDGADGAWLRVDIHPGLVLRTAADMTAVLQGLDLASFTIYFVAQESAAPVTALWLAATRELGYDPARLRGGVSNDVLGETIFGDGARVDMETALDLVAWAAAELPAFNALIPGAVLRESGLGASFEVAALMSTVREYLGRLRQKNLAGNFLPDRLHVVLPAGASILDEIAKFRAARVLYATYLQETAGITDGRMRIHAWTQDSLLAPVQTDVNLVRVALSTLAAVLGGAESVAAAPSEIPPAMLDQRTALRTAQVLLYETGIPLTADPCGGSEAIEQRTSAISADAYCMVERDTRWMRTEYRRRVEEERRKIARGERVIVGVNRFSSEPGAPSARPASAAPVRQPALTHAVESALARVEARARDRVNVMPALVEAATAGATLPAMLSTLRRGRARESR